MSRDRFPSSLETDRLFIRSAQPGDGELHHRAVHESLAELRPWLPSPPGPYVAPFAL